MYPTKRKERNEAKALGAKWGSNRTIWFVPKKASLDKFAKWSGERQLQLQKKYAGCICERRNAGSG
uniref:DUF5710 domain-containing protein n=1 Tax=Enterobacter kobei TaxID=208224 RepID=UPI00388F2E88